MSEYSKPVRSLWIGSKLGPYELASLLSLSQAGYDVGLYGYGKIPNVPGGIQLLAAQDILGEEHIFATPSSPGSFSAFSNVFRYQMLQQEEAVWVDTDILAGPNRIHSAEYLFGYEDKVTINGAVLAAPSQSEFLGRLIQRSALAPKDSLRWGQIGPKLITQVVSELGLVPLAQKPKVFYPIFFRDVWKLFSPNQTQWVEEQISGSATVHLWNEVLRRASKPIKNALPHPQSYLGRVFSDLGLADRKLEVVDPVWVDTQWRWESTWLASRLLGLGRRVRGIWPSPPKA